MNDLKDKVCLVTGGTRGIGHATVKALAAVGAKVAFNYQRSKEQAGTLCNEVGKAGGRALGLQGDVSVEAEVQRVVEEATRQLGPIQVLVNNAGITRDRSFIKMTKQQWDETLRVNLDGLFHTTHAVLPGMLASGWGRIINISSIVGETGNFGQANYAVTKGGAIAFTKSLARELARKNITVNAVSPGFIETDMTKGLSEPVLEQVRALTPLGRLGRPEEVAAAILFLAGESASYITGHVLSVNGGMHM